MKSIYTFFTFLLATSLLAQEPIEVRREQMVISKTSYPAFIVTIFETNEIFVEREWKSLMKDISKKVTTKKEWFIDNARIMSISQDTIDIYSKVVEQKNTGNVDLIVAFNVGGNFISPEDEKHDASAEKFIYEFAFRTTKLIVHDEVLAAEKSLEKANKEQTTLINQEEQLNRTIEKNTEKIEKAENDLEQNGKDLDKVNSEIEVKRSLVGSNPNEKDEKALQKALSKQSSLERNTDKLNSTIRNSKKKIEEAQYDLTKNTEDQEEQKVKVEKLTAELDSSRAKLMNIK